MQIRSETASDYAAIAALNVRAFGNRLAEALIVALLRQRSAFDPGLSLVAEVGGQIVGHVLFTPQRIRLMGESVRPVLLAPIAVDPRHQRRGVGSALIEAGHALAREQGYPFAMLVGHSSYYPRFGYQTHAFGSAWLSVTSTAAQLLETRTLAEADLLPLHALWLAQESEVDFAFEPLLEMVDWLSPDKALQATVFVRDGEIVGYSRAKADDTRRPACFLAHDAGVARSMIAHFAGQGSEVDLPVHPRSLWAEELGEAHAEAWEAAMVCRFAPSPLDDYLSQIKAGVRPPGRPLWGTAFEVE